MATRCDLCGLESALDNAFIRHGRQAYWCYCPKCWEDRRVRVMLQWVMIYVAVAAAFGGYAAFFGSYSDLCFAIAFALALPYSIVTTFLHELGHAAGALLVGFRLFTIRLGSMGRAVFSFRLFGYDFVFLSIPFGGGTLACCKSSRFVRLRHSFVVACGPLMHCLCISLALAVIRRWPDVEMLNGLMWSCIVVDSYLLLLSLWPSKHWTNAGSTPNDGLLLLTIPFAKRSYFDQDLAFLYYLEGLESLEREKLDDAAAWFRQGTAKFPDDIASATGLGIAYLELRKYEEARRCFLDLLQRKSLPPDQEAIVQNNLVWANLMLGDPELRSEADRLSKHAFGCLPWLPEVIGTRGSVLVELGEFETGMSMLERSLAAHHDDKSKALNAAYIALALTRQGLPVEAARRLEQARKLDPKCRPLGRIEAEIENAKRQAAT